MTFPPKRWARRTPARSRALLPALLFCLLPLGGTPAGADAPQNSIVSLQTIRTGPLTTYDIAVTSTAEFPMDDAIVTLNIGGTEFTNSHYAPSGTLNTLVFSLTRAQFLSLKSGAPVAVYYGADNAAIPAARWQFGALNTAMLDRGIAPTLVLPSPIKVTVPVGIAAPVKTSLPPSVKAAGAHAATPQKGKK